MNRSGKLSAKLAELQKEHDARENAGIALSGFQFEIGELEDMDIQFRPQRFAKTVERITVHSDGRLVFRFLVGKEGFESDLSEPETDVQTGLDPVPTSENTVTVDVEEAKRRLQDPQVQEEIRFILTSEEQDDNTSVA